MYVSQQTEHLKGIQLDSIRRDVRIQGINTTEDDKVQWQMQFTSLEYKKAQKMIKQEGKFQVMESPCQKPLKNGKVNMSEFQEHKRGQTQVLKVKFFYNLLIY